MSVIVGLAVGVTVGDGVGEAVLGANVGAVQKVRQCPGQAKASVPPQSMLRHNTSSLTPLHCGSAVVGESVGASVGATVVGCADDGAEVGAYVGDTDVGALVGEKQYAGHLAGHS